MDVCIHPDWKRILRKAWSMKCTALAGVFSGLVVLVPYVAPRVPLQLLAALASVANVGAGVTRLLSQREFRDG